MLGCVQLTLAQDMWLSLMDSATFLLDFDNQSAVRMYCGKVGKTSRRSELVKPKKHEVARWTRMSRGFKSPRFQPKTHILSDVLYNSYVTYAKIRSFLGFSQRSHRLQYRRSCRCARCRNAFGGWTTLSLGTASLARSRGCSTTGLRHQEWWPNFEEKSMISNLVSSQEYELAIIFQVYYFPNNKRHPKNGVPAFFWGDVSYLHQTFGMTRGCWRRSVSE